MAFLQGPQAQGLAQGLLSQAAPSMTEPRSLGLGLSRGMGLANQYEQAHKLQKLKEAEHELEKFYKSGMLDLNKQELAQKAKEHAAQLAQSGQHHKENLSLKQQELALEQEYKTAQIQKILDEAEQRRKRIEFLQKYANGEGLGTSSSTDYDTDKKQRVGILTALGYDEEAAKVIAEKKEKNPTEAPTTSFITTNQEVIQAADNAIPIIDKILAGDIPGAITGHLSPNAKADYESDVITLAEGLLKARGLPGTEGTLKKIIETVQIKPFESEEAYRKRLEGVKKEILERRERAAKITPVGSKEKGPKKKATYKDILAKHSVEDLEFTAKKRGITFDQLINKLIEQENRNA